MKAKINHDKLMEIVARLQEDNRMGDLEPFFPKFMELGDIIGQFQESTQVEEKEKLWDKFEECRSTIEQEFMAMVSGWGLSIDELKQYVEDPKNHSPEEWRKIEAMKHEVDGLIEKKASRQPGKKRQPNWA